MQKNNLKLFTNINKNIPKRTIVSIGFFDGLHLGHRYVLDYLHKRAKENNREDLVITLWPHPAAYFGKPISLLSLQDEKIKMLDSLSVSNLLILEFNAYLSSLSFQEFIQKILFEQLAVDEIIMGYNNSFGNKNIDTENLDTANSPIKIIKLNDCLSSSLGNISSSNIRKLIAEGEVDVAAQLLGYKYFLSGKIVEGNKIGRKLGFPTANLGFIDPQKLIPANGVYAVKVSIDEQQYFAMLNIGHKPSFGNYERTLEFHILNYKSNIYGKMVSIEFYKKMRDEQHFHKIDDLIVQLQKDKYEIENYFKNFKIK